MYTRETKDVVLNCLTQKNVPMKAGEIAEATGLEKKAVDAAIKAEEKISSPKRCYYACN